MSEKTAGGKVGGSESGKGGWTHVVNIPVPPGPCYPMVINGRGEEVIQLTPQQIDEWRLQRDIAAMLAFWTPEKGEPPQGVSAIAGPPRRGGYEPRTDMKRLPHGGSVRAKHLTLH